MIFFPPNDGLVMKTSAPLLRPINLTEMGAGQSFCTKSGESRVAGFTFLGYMACGLTGMASLPKFVWIIISLCIKTFSV